MVKTLPLMGIKKKSECADVHAEEFLDLSPPQRLNSTFNCRIQHSLERVCGDEEMKRGKNALKKLTAAETLNNITILSQKRQEQVVTLF